MNSWKSSATVAALSSLVLIAWLNLPLEGAASAAPYGREPGLASPGDVPQLIATLERAEATVPEKARACQQLSLVGTKDATAALAKLLAHPQLAAYARTALEAIADPAAGEVLRAALGTLDGRFLVGVVNTLGVRRDAASVDALIRLARDPARGAAPEALVALGRIGTLPALEVLRAALAKDPAELRAAAAEGCLVSAEQAMAGGNPESAMPLYDAVRQASVPAPFRHAGLRGVILARPAEGWPLLLEALKSQDTGLRKVAATIAREAPGQAIARGLVEALPTVEPALQVVLLGTLSQRGERTAATAVEALVAAESVEVRTAAIGALGTAGGFSSAPVLLRVLATEHSAEESAAAVNSLVRLSVDGVDRVVLQALPSAAPGARVRLIQVLGQRRVASATPELLKQAAGSDPAVSRAAFDALAAVASPRELPEMIGALAGMKEAAVRNQAERALYAVAVKEPAAERRSEPLVAALRPGLEPAARISLLQVMSMLADPAAARTVAAAYDDSDAEVREAALRLLVHWPDAAPAARLLGIFQTTKNETHRGLALQGVVTLATLWKDDPARPTRASAAPPKEAVQWLMEANAAIRNDVAEKKAILGGLGDLNCGEGIRLLRPYLDDPAVRLDAGRALLRAAKGLTTAEDKTAARPLVEKVRETGDADLRREAEAVLKSISGGNPP